MDARRPAAAGTADATLQASNAMTAIPPQSSSDSRIITSAAAGHGQRVLTVSAMAASGRTRHGLSQLSWQRPRDILTRMNGHSTDSIADEREDGKGKSFREIRSVGERCGAKLGKYTHGGKRLPCAA